MECVPSRLLLRPSDAGSKLFLSAVTPPAEPERMDWCWALQPSTSESWGAALSNWHRLLGPEFVCSGRRAAMADPSSVHEPGKHAIGIDGDKRSLTARQHFITTIQNLRHVDVASSPYAQLS